MLPRKVALPLFLAAFSIGASGQLAAAESTDSADSSKVVRVEIANYNFQDVRVYAVSGTRTHRLGTITGFTTEVFKLPSWFSVPGGELSFVIRPIGSRSSFVSLPVYIDPGDDVELRVQNHMALTNAVVR